MIGSQRDFVKKNLVDKILTYFHMNIDEFILFTFILKFIIT